MSRWHQHPPKASSRSAAKGCCGTPCNNPSGTSPSSTGLWSPGMLKDCPLRSLATGCAAQSSFQIPMNMVSTQTLKANTPAIAPTVLLLNKNPRTQHSPGKGLSIGVPARTPQHQAPPIAAKRHSHLRDEGLTLLHGPGRDKMRMWLVQAAGPQSPDSPQAEQDRTPLLSTPPMTVTHSLSQRHRAGSARHWHTRCCARPARTKPQLQEFPRKAKLSLKEESGGGQQLRGPVTVTHCWLEALRDK